MATDFDQTAKTGTTFVTLLTAEASIPEEPGAGKLHAGICAGAVGQLAVLPRCQLQVQQVRV